MAAVEDPAGLTSIESATGLSCIDTDPCNDMKNTARKSTSKAAQRATPPPVVNGNAETNNGNHVVSNGDGPHKRALEEEDLSNPAKTARLHIEEMEKAQEEMTRKISREEDMVVQNGEAEVSNGSNSEDKSNDSNSKNKKNSLTLTADVKDTFKGIIDVAMAKVGSRRSSANDSETVLSPNSSSQDGKEEDTLHQEGQEGEEIKQQNGTENKDDANQRKEVVVESNGQACPEAKLLEGDVDEANHSGEVDEAILLSEEEGQKEDTTEQEAKTTELVADSPKESNEKDSETVAEKDSEKERVLENEDNVQSNDSCDKSSGANEEGVTPTAGVEEKGEDDEKSENKLNDKSSDAGKSDKEVDKVEETESKESDAIDQDKSQSKATDIPADKVINLDDDDEGDDVDADAKISESESKLESDINNPIEIEDDDDNADLKSEASDASWSRKRGAPSPAPSDTSSTTKKSRLDKVIGRLGSAVGINSGDSPTPAATPTSECNDEEKAAVVDLDVDNDVDMKDDVKPDVANDVKPDVANDVKPDVANDVKPDVANDVKPDVANDVKPTYKPGPKSRRKCTQEVRQDLKHERNPNAEKKLITLTVEELNELLVRRMNAFLERSRGSLIVQLQTRIGELQTAVESWRAQAKRLAKQLDEEVARSSQRRHAGGKMARRRTNSDDVRIAQLAAASLQQQGGGGGKVTVRTPPRPTGPSPQGLVNNSVRVGTTVRDLLDKQRGGSEPAPKGQPVHIQGNRILVPGTKLVGRNSVVPGVRPPATVVRTVTSQAGGAGKSVIDLTDDDDRNKAAEGKGRGGAQLAVRAPGAGSQGTGPGRPGTVLVQQMPTSGGPVIVQQVVSQPVRTAQGTTYVYTSTRPGSLAIQTAPGTSLVRPALVTATAPPTLRPANQVVTLTRGPASAVRPPPPLRSAPGTMITSVVSSQGKHPAPLPPQPDLQPLIGAKQPPPKPGLKISRVQSGIVLSWNMTVTDVIAHISSYQLFAYQETSVPPSTALWKKVGDVKALPLPMACTLTQFQEGNKYHFAVRAVDVHSRVGPFSDPSSIALTVINVS